jgi:hypothetical protein
VSPYLYFFKKYSTIKLKARGIPEQIVGEKRTGKAYEGFHPLIVIL